MTSPPPPSLPSLLVSSITNNHIPPDSTPEALFSLPPVPTRQSLTDALAHTDAAIRAIDDKLAQVFFRNATFSREGDGLRNLNNAIDWFSAVRQQASQHGQTAVTGRQLWNSGDEELEGLLSTRNTTTAILVLLNGLHTAFVLSSETEKNLVSGQVDKAYENLTRLETAVKDVREKNGELSVVGMLAERVGVLKDILCVETEKVWSKLVLFSEEGDIQLTIRKHLTPTETSTLSIDAVAELLQQLGLLDETMKSLASLLSRAFLEHLLSNPVGWQFIYRKHSPTDPSITMTPTNFTLADLTPHAHRIFAYLGCITDFLDTNLPPTALQVLIPLLVPAMTSHLTTSWLNTFIPPTLETWEEYATLVRSAQDFDSSLQQVGWTSAPTDLGQWCTNAGQNWARQRKINVLDQVRTILRSGVLPNNTIVASVGAPQYENTPATVQDWTWDNNDWGNSPSGPPNTGYSTSTTNTAIGRRKQRPSMSSQPPRTYECTALSTPLRRLLGTLLQQYTLLPSIPLLASAQPLFVTIIPSMFTLFRASGTIHAGTAEETPVRLCNDCAYLAGETGLLAVGMREVGLRDLGEVLEQVSAEMDFCGVYWRERYLDNLRAGVISRVQAAEGFVFASRGDRRERYAVVIEGVIQQIRALSTMWSRVTTPQERFSALGPIILTVLGQVLEDILLLPTLAAAETAALAALFIPLLSMENLFPRNRVTEFMPSWGKYKLVPTLLEGDVAGITGLWRTGRVSSSGWDGSDVVEILERRFGHTADGLVREIRKKEYAQYSSW